MYFTEEIKIFLLAMTPLGELRISLPVALTIYRLDWFSAYLISVIGNLVPIILLLLFLEPVSRWLSKNFQIFQKFFSWIFARTRKKYNAKIEKYGKVALLLFVALPLPLTGGWSGSLVAFLYGIPFKTAFPLITLGIMIAGVIVLLATLAGITIEKYFGWKVLAGLLLVIGLIWILYNMVLYNIMKREPR